MFHYIGSVVAIASLVACYKPTESNPTEAVDAAVNGALLDATVDSDRPARVTTGLQAIWPFDEGAGDVVHDRRGLTPAYDLARPSPTTTTWSAAGLTFIEPTCAKSAMMLGRPVTACGLAGVGALEAWITATNDTQGASARPAIIAGLVGSINSRGFEISQDRKAIVAHARTSSVPTAPPLYADNVIVPGQRIHVMLVQEPTAQKLYINGELKGQQVTSVMAWESFAMFVGADVGLNAPWLGTVSLVSLYCSALTAAQVKANFDYGPKL
jgi:hypothetical protein